MSTEFSSVFAHLSVTYSHMKFGQFCSMIYAFDHVYSGVSKEATAYAWMKLHAHTFNLHSCRQTDLFAVCSFVKSLRHKCVHEVALGAPVATEFMKNIQIHQSILLYLKKNN